MSAPAKSHAPAKEGSTGGPWENYAPTAPMVVCFRRRIESTRTEHDGYKNGLDFIITLVVVNSNCTFLLVTLLNKIVTC